MQLKSISGILKYLNAKVKVMVDKMIAVNIKPIIGRPSPLIT